MTTKEVPGVAAVHPSITEDADPPAEEQQQSLTHPFEVRDEITVDATPDEVWEAVASGPGVHSWLMGRTEIDSASKTSTFNMFGEASSTAPSLKGAGLYHHRETFRPFLPVGEQQVALLGGQVEVGCF